MKKYYVVCKGRKLGVFGDWTECLQQIESYRSPEYRKFNTAKEAYSYIRDNMPAGEHEYIIATEEHTGCYPEYHVFMDVMEKQICYSAFGR